MPTTKGEYIAAREECDVKCNKPPTGFGSHERDSATIVTIDLNIDMLLSQQTVSFETNCGVTQREGVENGPPAGIVDRAYGVPSNVSRMRVRSIVAFTSLSGGWETP